MAKGLRESALPVSLLLECVFGDVVSIICLEDNLSTIQIIRKGRSPALRHLSKTHRISLSWVCEVINDTPGISLEHCPTNDQLADSFTKSLDRAKHQLALKQLHIF